MPEARGPAVYSIPVTRPFADMLVAKLLADHRADRMALARGLVLVPSNRAGIAIRDAFVRQASTGLLLPRIVALGDPELDERAGTSFDAIAGDPIPPAIEPLKRQLILARLIQQQDRRDAGEAMRLAAELARVLDQLTIEERSGRDLTNIELTDALSSHWDDALARMKVILEMWPEELAAIGCIDLADRRNRLLDRTAQRWREAPPAGFVVAAGISTAAPAVARLLRTIALMERGAVVLAGLDPHLRSEDWDRLDGDDPVEAHPQFHLRQLLDRIGVARGEVEEWLAVSKADGRGSTLTNVFALPDRTKGWSALERSKRTLRNVTALELSTASHEAQAIALVVRQALETPARTVAVVTPDRELAVRVSAHLSRWGIVADDSAGRPLTSTPPGSLVLALAVALAGDFAPAPLVALLKHPLVQAGDRRQAWLDNVRALDIVLRGPRPAPGLKGLSAFLLEGDERARGKRERVRDWWQDAGNLLEPLERANRSLPSIVATLREVGEGLCGERLWAGQDGRLLARLVADLEADGALGPEMHSVAELPILLRQVMDAIAVRPGYGGHPRVFIWGLIEARLQSADLMILAGLNEGVWPSLPAPDPWLAPPVRRDLGLPGLERSIGLAAHDLASAMGSPEVILTRARRDASGPAIPSRFWLRIEALTGGLQEPAERPDLLAASLDGLRGAAPQRAARPRENPPREERPTTVSVTEVDRLSADPYAFYAQKMMQLRSLDRLDADPGPAWRGTLIHDVLKLWAKGGYPVDGLVTGMEQALHAGAIHPLIRALWLPRLVEAARWIEAEVTANRAECREPVLAEEWGEAEIDGITIGGRADRIDQLTDGNLVIVDYKTGAPPTQAQVREGFALQLGLIGLIAEHGGYGTAAPARGFEYWSLDRDPKTRAYGRRSSPVQGKQAVAGPEDFVAFTAAKFAEAAAKYLFGGQAPFLAKLAPQFTYGEYDQLMRLEEWEGRDA